MIKLCICVIPQEFFCYECKIKSKFFSPHTTGALFTLSTFELKWSTTMRTPPHYTPTAHEILHHEVFVCCYSRVIKKFNEFATHTQARPLILMTIIDQSASSHLLIRSGRRPLQQDFSSGGFCVSEHTKQVICGQQIHLPEREPSRAKRDTRMRLSQPIAFSFTTLRISSFVFCFFFNGNCSLWDDLSILVGEIAGFCEHKWEAVEEMRSFYEAASVKKDMIGNHATNHRHLVPSATWCSSCAQEVGSYEQASTLSSVLNTDCCCRCRRC